MPAHPWGESHLEKYTPAQFAERAIEKIRNLPEDKADLAVDLIAEAFRERDAASAQILEGVGRVLFGAVGLL